MPAFPAFMDQEFTMSQPANSTPLQSYARALTILMGGVIAALPAWPTAVMAQSTSFIDGFVTTPGSPPQADTTVAAGGGMTMVINNDPTGKGESQFIVQSGPGKDATPLIVTDMQGTAINTADTGGLATNIGSANAAAGTVLIRSGVDSVVNTSIRAVTVLGPNIYINNVGTDPIAPLSPPTGDTTIGNATGTVTLLGTTNINGQGIADTTIGNGTGSITLLGPTRINTDGTGATDIGNGNADTVVTATGGTGRLSLANDSAVIGVDGGGSFSAGSGSAMISGTGPLATNGTSGTSSGMGAGAVTVHSAARTIAPGTTINNALAGKSYQTQVNGNMYVDGNMYINGTIDYVSSNSATTTVIGEGTATSTLVSANQGTTGGTAIVMKGATGTRAVVDNGVISMTSSGQAAESSVAMTLTDGVGNTHGLAITESNTVLSGGTHSTSMVLDDGGVTFRDTSGGGPARLTGVADGSGDFDATNYRQLRNVIRGVASATAIANIPQVDPGKRFAVGVGLGAFDGQTAVAVGASVRYRPNLVMKLSVGTVSGTKPTVGMGAAMSW
jgi:hypothetical protein